MSSTSVALLVDALLGLGARVGDVGREQLEAAVPAAVREAPDAVVAERPHARRRLPSSDAGRRRARPAALPAAAAAGAAGAACSAGGAGVGATGGAGSTGTTGGSARRGRSGCQRRQDLPRLVDLELVVIVAATPATAQEQPDREQEQQHGCRDAADQRPRRRAARVGDDASGGGCCGAAEVNTCLTFSSEIFSVGEAVIVFRATGRGRDRRARRSSGTRPPPGPSSAGRDSRSPSAAGTCPS